MSLPTPLRSHRVNHLNLPALPGILAMAPLLLPAPKQYGTRMLRQALTLPNFFYTIRPIVIRPTQKKESCGYRHWLMRGLKHLQQDVHRITLYLTIHRWPDRNSIGILAMAPCRTK